MKTRSVAQAVKSEKHWEIEQILGMDAAGRWEVQKVSKNLIGQQNSHGEAQK